MGLAHYNPRVDAPGNILQIPFNSLPVRNLEEDIQVQVVEPRLRVIKQDSSFNSNLIIRFDVSCPFYTGW